VVKVASGFFGPADVVAEAVLDLLDDEDELLESLSCEPQELPMMPIKMTTPIKMRTDFRQPPLFFCGVCGGPA
jgi:hypothetical protein